MEVIRSKNNNTRRSTGNGIVAEQKCKQIERRDPDSLRSDPNIENWKETSRNKEMDGNRRKTRKGRMMEQIRKTTERDRTDGNSHRTHGNGREQAGMSRESRRTMEKVRENTVHDNQHRGWKSNVSAIKRLWRKDNGHFLKVSASGIKVLNYSWKWL